MNVIDFFKLQTTKWNDESKCGFCWEYDAPLRDSDANESVIKNDTCCMRVLITNYSFRKNRVTDNTTGLLKEYSEDYTFTLNIVMPDIVDNNVYQEQDHPISESKWKTILKPIQDCFKNDMPFDFCDILGRDDVSILSENWVTRIDWLDNNYTGFGITMTLKDKNPL